MIYYHTRLSELSSKKQHILILSLLLRSRSKQTRVSIAQRIGLSERQVRKHINELIEKGLIDSKLRIQFDFPKRMQRPYIGIDEHILQTQGLSSALLQCWAARRADAQTLPRIQKLRETTLPKTTFHRYENVFRKDLPMKEQDIIASVKKRYQRKVQSVKGAVRVSEVRMLFQHICSAYGYKFSSIPSKQDITIALSIQKMTMQQGISLKTLIEYMVKNWRKLSSMGDESKPMTPSLGKLKICYKEIMDIIAAESVELVPEKKAAPKQDTEEIAEYYQQQIREG